MKQIIALLAIVIAYGASGRAFGIDPVAYETKLEPVVVPVVQMNEDTD